MGQIVFAQILYSAEALEQGAVIQSMRVGSGNLLIILMRAHSGYILSGYQLAGSKMLG